MTRPLDTTKPLRLAEAKAGLDRLRALELAKTLKQSIAYFQKKG